ncbi:MAG: radical SAM/Cys-rich domain protein [Melioribacteraceae bacterium]|nr:MAG: radical SAM/Cys-rich domain protein [Melioribacteraceae bacterium]
MPERHKSMKAFGEKLAAANTQLEILEKSDSNASFNEFYKSTGEERLIAVSPEIFQINLGKMCNQVCKHCHVDAGPDRKEIMTKETLEMCLSALETSTAKMVDLTGGAPEMNPEFKWFVEEVRKLDKHILVRSNLTILEASGFKDYAEFFANNRVEVVSSLPYYRESLTDKQRGTGVFQKSISALQKLNKLGYAKDDSGLVINLVYNPVGAFLPPSQGSLEKDYKRELKNKFDVEFNNLFTITNMPISRFLDYLIASGNYKSYMQKLIDAFNPAAALNVMCKNTISIGWDGYIYDCDFNQMLELKIKTDSASHIRNYNESILTGREIITGKHCFGCTAGAGSSCGGETV